IPPLGFYLDGYCAAGPSGTGLVAGCANASGTFDIDAAMMALTGILDVANLNRKDLSPNGMVILGTDGNLYADSTTGVSPYYVDGDGDGKISCLNPLTDTPDYRQADPQFTNPNFPKYNQSTDVTTVYGNLCSEAPRGYSSALWITGSLIVKD